MAGAGGLLLLASMFMPWFGVDVQIEVPGESSPIVAEDERASAWVAFGFIDLVLFASGCLGLVLGARALSPRLPRNEILIAVVAGLSALAAGLILLRLLIPPEFGIPDDSPNVSIGRRVGAFFGLVGAGAMGWGALLALQAGGGGPAAVTLRRLRDEACRSVPAGAGVFVVRRADSAAPVFLEQSPGARRDGRDPALTAKELEANWVEGASTLYVARASALRRRIRELVRFGSGEQVSNWGGRALWQLEDAGELEVRWRETDDPRSAEEELLTRFRSEHDAPPFANDPHRLGH